MSNQCDQNDASVAKAIINPLEAIEVIGGNRIKVTKSETESKATYTVNYNPYSEPKITVNSAIHKVGTTVPSFEFTGNIEEGSESIVSREMIPDKGLDLTQQFSWTETNIQGIDTGLWPQYNGEPTLIRCTDFEGNTIEKYAGLEFRYLFYMGFSINDIITESDVKAFSNQDLLTNIISKYSSYTYNYTVVPTYLYWVFPLGTQVFTEAYEGPLPVPLKLDHPNINITDEGITKTYRVIRTAVRTRFNNATIILK